MDQRYFSSQIGRFLTPDPSRSSGGPSDPGSWNRYAYVGGDPINYFDPNGLDRCTFEFDPRTNTYRLFCLFREGRGGGGGGGGGGNHPQLEQLPDSEGPQVPQPQGRSGSSIRTSGVNREGDNQKVIEAALNSLKVFIDDDCKKWLESGRMDFGQLVDQAMPYIGHGTITTTRPGQIINAVTSPADAAGFLMVINDNGAFFSSSSTTNNGRIAGNTVQARIFILLHEFGHVYQTIEPDADDDRAQERNNNAISTNCRKTLDKFR